MVALLTEGVDRNNLNLNNPRSNSKSPSSRRAWIEIFETLREEGLGDVALLTEGVDRNNAQAAVGVLLACRPPHGGRG